MTAESEAQRRQSMIEHLARIADMGSKEYAWRSAKAYESIDPYCMAGLQAEFGQYMKARAAEQVAA